MRKLLLILFLLFTVGTSHSQKKTELNPSLYGYWVNLDGEVLIIELNKELVITNCEYLDKERAKSLLVF